MYLPTDLRTFVEPATLEELAFAVTQKVMEWLPAVPQTDDFMSAVGVLETVKLEFFRRATAPHLDEERKDNADVGYETL